METEGTYTYPLAKREDIVEFLSGHQSYWPMSYWNGGFCLAWNIKVYRFDASGTMYREDFDLQERFDAAWEQYIEDNDHGALFGLACEDATYQYTQGEWTRYPGVEQGEYEFAINGRSGGWMILKDWAGPTPGGALFPMIWRDHDDYVVWLEDLDTKNLEKFYRVIVQLDHDLSREGCRRGIEYQFALLRADWEEEQEAGEERMARELEKSRGDMYGEEPHD